MIRTSKIAAALVAGVLTSAPLVLANPAWAADTPGCVTRAEFKKVSKGMTKQRVTRIFDNRGKLSSYYAYDGDVYTTREYNPCAKYASIYVDYKNGLVKSKNGYWA